MQTTQTTGRIASPNTYTMYSIHTVISKFQFMSKRGGQKNKQAILVPIKSQFMIMMMKFQGIVQDFKEFRGF